MKPEKYTSLEQSIRLKALEPLMLQFKTAIEGQDLEAIDNLFDQAATRQNIETLIYENIDLVIKENNLSVLNKFRQRLKNFDLYKLDLKICTKAIEHKNLDLIENIIKVSDEKLKLIEYVFIQFINLKYSDGIKKLIDLYKNDVGISEQIKHIYNLHVLDQDFSFIEEWIENFEPGKEKDYYIIEAFDKQIYKHNNLNLLKKLISAASCKRLREELVNKYFERTFFYFVPAKYSAEQRTECLQKLELLEDFPNQELIDTLFAKVLRINKISYQPALQIAELDHKDYLIIAKRLLEMSLPYNYKQVGDFCYYADRENKLGLQKYLEEKSVSKQAGHKILSMAKLSQIQINEIESLYDYAYNLMVSCKEPLISLSDENGNKLSEDITVNVIIQGANIRNFSHTQVKQILNIMKELRHVEFKSNLEYKIKFYEAVYKIVTGKKFNLGNEHISEIKSYFEDIYKNINSPSDRESNIVQSNSLFMDVEEHLVDCLSKLPFGDLKSKLKKVIFNDIYQSANWEEKSRKIEILRKLLEMSFPYEQSEIDKFCALADPLGNLKLKVQYEEKNELAKKRLELAKEKFQSLNLIGRKIEIEDVHKLFAYVKNYMEVCDDPIKALKDKQGNPLPDTVIANILLHGAGISSINELDALKILEVWQSYKKMVFEFEIEAEICLFNMLYSALKTQGKMKPATTRNLLMEEVKDHPLNDNGEEIISTIEQIPTSMTETLQLYKSHIWQTRVAVGAIGSSAVAAAAFGTFGVGLVYTIPVITPLIIALPNPLLILGAALLLCLAIAALAEYGLNQVVQQDMNHTGKSFQEQLKENLLGSSQFSAIAI